MPQTAGILGVVTLDEHLSYPRTLRIGRGFPVTSHLVKFSHHPSGRAHFSLTGKVASTVSRQACPLSEVRGHLFTARAQGITHFQSMNDKDKGSSKRGVIPFGFEETTPHAIKLVAYLWTEDDLNRNTSDTNGDKPWLLLKLADGSSCLGILLATPIKHLGKTCYLVLSIQAIPTIIRDRDFFFNFMGGFDPSHIALDHSQATSWLTSIYPSSVDNAALLDSGRNTIDLAT